MPKSTKTSPPIQIVGAQLTLLEISLIRIDHDNYQRSQIPAHVNRITRDFDIDLFDAPTIIHRMNGTYWAADGQQRLAAARILGFTHVWAKVVHARDIEHEAWLFTQLNILSRKLGAQDIYKANLVWGEQISVAIEEVLNNHGLTALHKGSAAEVRAIQKLREAWGPAATKIGTVVDDKTLQHGKDVVLQRTSDSYRLSEPKGKSGPDRAPWGFDPLRRRKSAGVVLLHFQGEGYPDSCNACPEVGPALVFGGSR